MASVHWRVSLMVLTFALHADSSHYRGGIIYWKPVDPTDTEYPIVLDVTYRIAWRRSAGYLCDSSSIASRTPFAAGDTLRCFGGASCQPTFKHLVFFCTDFSVSEDWTSGTNSYKLTLSSDDDRDFFLRYGSCCWIPLLIGGNDSWRVRSNVILDPRSDNGLINSSPQTTITPIVRVQQGCTRVFTIKTFDPDGDDVRCREGNNTEECGTECNLFAPIATLQNDCKLSINTTGQPAGLYRATLVIEDFIDPSSTTPLSSIPLQFIIRVFDSTVPCSQEPHFTDQSPDQSQCIPFAVGFESSFKIYAKPGNPLDPIVRFITSSPLGLLAGSLNTTDPDQVSTSYSWTPTHSQLGFHLFCATAESSLGIPSDQLCVVINVITTIPQLVSINPPEGTQIPPTQSQWNLTYDSDIVQPKTPTFVSFYRTDSPNVLMHRVDVSDSTNVAFIGRVVVINTPGLQLQQGVKYSITLDKGVVIGRQGCGTESSPVTTTNTIILRVQDGCDGQGTGMMMPDPDSCVHYVLCVNGIPYRMPCAPGTKFSPQKNMCVHGYMVECSQGPVTNDPCELVADGDTMKDPNDCRKYIVCVHERSHSMACAPGTAYNVASKTCMHSAVSVCETSLE